MVAPATDCGPVLVDTDVVSFFLRDDTRALSYERHLRSRLLLISFVTVGELYRGALVRGWSETRRGEMEQALEAYVWVGYDRRLSLVWAEMMASSAARGRVPAANDSWIAATALLAGVPLVTHNRRHFAAIAGLDVLSEAPATI